MRGQAKRSERSGEEGKVPTRKKKAKKKKGRGSDSSNSPRVMFDGKGNEAEISGLHIIHRTRSLLLPFIVVIAEAAD